MAWIGRMTGSLPTAAVPLHGGFTAAVHRIEFGDRPPLVAKRFVDRALVAREPDLAVREAAMLDLLAGTSLPTPVPVAVDAEGAIAGCPTVLMTYLGGMRVVPAPDPDALAGLAAAVHRLDLPGLTPFARYVTADTARAPRWGDGGLWREVLAATAAPPPAGPAVFIHRDFHHHNVLWSGGCLIGIVDWLSACLGPPGVDLARCRLNTALDGCPEVGDAVLAAYLRLGPADLCQPYWDLVDVVDLLEDFAAVSGGGPGRHARHRARLEGFARRALEGLSRAPVS